MSITIRKFRTCNRLTDDLPVALLIIALMLVGGCAANLEQRLTQAEATSTFTINTAVDASEAGVIDREQFNTFYTQYIPAAKSLVAARSLVEARPEDAKEYIDMFFNALRIARSTLEDYGVRVKSTQEAE